MRKHNLRSKPRILIADDSRDMVDVCRFILSAAGYRVQCAYDGLTAAALAKVTRPDLAILNYHMPGLTGLRVLREMRAAGVRTKVIITSGTSDFAALAERAMEGGAEACVRQPGPAGWLLRLVPALLEPRGSLRG